MTQVNSLAQQKVSKGTNETDVSSEDRGTTHRMVQT